MYEQRSTIAQRSDAVHYSQSRALSFIICPYWTGRLESAYSLMKPVFVEQESDSIQIPSPPSHGHMLHSKETGLFLRSGGQA